MITPIKLFVLTLILWFCAPFAQAEGMPIVASMGGSGVATAVIEGIEQEIRIGLALPIGSTVKTGPKNSVMISYADGSLVAVDADTRYQINESRDGAQTNTLQSGQVRGSISKLKEKINNSPQKHHFMIRTKAAVMGVRGTEFVMGVDATGYATQIHTLEGVVDVGASEASLSSGTALAVESGKFVEATETGLSAVRAFDPLDFKKNLFSAKEAGKVPGVAFTNDKGITTVVKEVPQVGFIQSENKPKVDERRLPPEEQAKQALNPSSPENKKDPELAKAPDDSRRINFLNFQAGIYGIVERIRTPDPSPSNPYQTKTFERLYKKAVHLSWNPEIPIPYTAIFSVKGHLGCMLAEDGSLYNRYWVREAQVFGVATLLNRVYGEVGWGWQLENDKLTRVYTLGAGMIVGFGKGLDRIYVEISNFFPEENFMMVKLGFGIHF